MAWGGWVRLIKAQHPSPNGLIPASTDMVTCCAKDAKDLKDGSAYKIRSQNNLSRIAWTSPSSSYVCMFLYFTPMVNPRKKFILWYPSSAPHMWHHHATRWKRLPFSATNHFCQRWRLVSQKSC
jgi:hypothetical protein